MVKTLLVASISDELVVNNHERELYRTALTHG
jgi:hypothetical protein